jgi:hypothetical protein
VIAEDEACEDLSDEQITAAAEQLLDVAGNELQEALGSRGNDFLGDYWAGSQLEILADVVKPPAV